MKKTHRLILLTTLFLLHIIGLNAQRPFITEWTNVGNAITIPTSAGMFNQDVLPFAPFGYVYDYTIKYYKKQDSINTVNILLNQTGNVTINTTSYLANDTLVVEIEGDFPHFYMQNGMDRNKLVNIRQWGDIQWKDFHSAFYGCSYLNITANDTPLLLNVYDMARAFERTTNFNGSLANWDVSSVKTMAWMFEGAASFNQDLSLWDVSSVEDMKYMFHYTGQFNGNIETWDVSSVKNMEYMFGQALAFNQDLSAWDVSSVENMKHMFSFSAFNGNISTWDVSSVVDMESMFAYNSAFNSAISNWNVASVQNMAFMFSHATAFNQDLSTWNVSSVITMREMFYNAQVFTSDISNWNVSSVTNMNWMFYKSTSFNSDLGGWDVSNVTTMVGMFSEASSFDRDISNWDVSNVTNMSMLFSKANVFNQDLSSWNPVSVTNMVSIFTESGISYCNFDKILIGWSQKPLQPNLQLGGNGLLNPKYTNNALAALTTLTSPPYNWQVYVALYYIPTISMSTPSSACFGDLITVQATSSLSSMVFMWPDSLLGTTHNYVVQHDTTIIVTAEDPQELGCFLYDTTTVIVYPLPNVSIYSPNVNVCENDSISFSANGAIDYLWNNQATGNSTTYVLSQDSIITVIGTDMNGCKGTDSISLQVNLLPSVTIHSNKDSICPEESVVLTAQGANTYIWNTLITGNQIIEMPHTTTIYSVEGTDLNGCKGTDSLEIVVNTQPQITVYPLGATCVGTIVLFAATGATSYEWEDLSTSPITSFIISNDTNLIVKGVNTNGCIGYDTLEVTALPEPTVVITPMQPTCKGSEVEVVASGAMSYFWPNLSNENKVLLIVQNDTSLIVRGEDVNGCVGYDTLEIVAHDLPIILISSDTTDICKGSEVELTATGANVYEWNTQETTQSIVVAPDTNTTYIVKGTDLIGCASEASILISVKECVGVDEQNFGVTIFPNPTSDFVSIYMQGLESSNALISLIDLSGKVLYKTPWNETSFVISFQSLASGCYFIKIETERAVVIEKVIKK